MRKGLYLVIICFLATAFGVLAFFHIWFNMQMRFINIRFQELNREKLILKNDIDKLRCEKEYLRSPERLEKLADKFDMTLPDEEPIIIIK
ncbi:TPA: cell division protein FtsL [Candidatus Poribacteria bacterium]|nr:cell division protein FtsL [Candidatus Poribacteria bacterium]HEX29050.1 cell division protein FtsL [Candidatus Poribacteria bacterium]